MSIQVDWFQAGYAVSSEEPSREAMVVMSRDAEAFMRAGGWISWDKWRSLSPESRSAWIDAGNRIAVERAVLSGLASSDRAAAMSMLESLDDGKTKVRRVLSEAVEALVRRLDRTEP